MHEHFSYWLRGANVSLTDDVAKSRWGAVEALVHWTTEPQKALRLSASAIASCIGSGTVASGDIGGSPKWRCIVLDDRQRRGNAGSQRPRQSLSCSRGKDRLPILQRSAWLLAHSATANRKPHRV